MTLEIIKNIIKERAKPLQIAAIYASLGAFWIFFSDSLLDFFVQNIALYRQAQTYKGWFYILITSALLYYLITHNLKRSQIALSELKRERLFLSALLDNVGEAIVSCDEQGKLVRFNKAAQRLHGLPKNPILPDELAEHYELFKPDGRTPLPKEDAPLFRALQGEKVRNAEVVFAPKKGTPRSLIVDGQAIKDGAGRILGAVIAMHDITDKKKAEVMLREKEALLSQTGRIAKIGGWEFDPLTLKGTWTDEVARIHDMDPRDETDVETGLSFYHGEHRQKIEQAIKEAIESGKPYDLELELITAKGNHKWVRAIGRPVKDGNKVIKIGGSIQDITESKEREIEINKVSRALKVLNKGSEALIRATDEPQLLTEICSTIVNVGGYRLAWIGYRVQDEFKTVKPVSQHGYEDGYLDIIKITWADTEQGRGPTGTAIRTGAPVVCKDMLSDPSYILWRDDAIRRGYRSSIAIPLKDEGEIFGALNIYAQEPDAFNDNEVKLLNELANDLAYGIRNLRMRAEKEKAQEALTEREQYYRSLINNMQEDIIVIDSDYRITDVNNAFLAATGNKREEVLGRFCYEVLHARSGPCSGKGYGCKLKTVLESGEPSRMLRQYIGAEGKKGWVNILFSPLYDKYGKITHIIEAVHDITELVESREAMKESQERYRNIIEASPVGIAVYSRGKLTFSNMAGARILGAGSPEELIGKPIKEIVHPDSWDTASERIQRILEGEKGLPPTEGRYVRLDGKTIIVEEIATLLTYEGAPAIQVIVQDITNKKEMQEALKETEARLKLAVQTTDIAFWNWDLETNMVDYSPNWKRQIGYEDEEFGRDFSEWQRLLHPNDRDWYLNKIYKYIDNPWPDYEEEFRFRHKDGTYRWILSRASLLQDETGKPIRMMGFHLDITERKRIENMHMESEERFRSLFELAPDTYFLLDNEGRFLDANKKGEEIVGYQKREVIGKSFLDSGLLPEDQKSKAMEMFEKNRKNIETSPEEINLKRRDGQIVPVELITIPIKMNDKDIILGIARDISERKQLEKQLIQAQKMEAIGTLAGGIAHDFNNILTTIIGDSDYLLMEFSKGDESYEVIDEIRKAGERGATLTRQLLAFSRKQLIQPRVLDINEVLRESEKMLKRLIREDIKFQTILEQDLWGILSDPGQIEQIFMNLVVNASDAMPEGGEITIKTENTCLDETSFQERGVKSQPGQYIMIAVSDTGLGIATEIQPRIFDPFYTTKERGKGTGLGLSTVYGIVKQNGGYIWVYSEPGKGTTFKIYLPKHEGEADFIPTGVKTPSIGEFAGSETVLIAEDDKSLRKFEVRTLKRYGYKILEAEDAEQSLRIGKEYRGPIHLLLTDVIMPGMSGRDLADRLKKERSEMKVLFMSGYTDDLIVNHGILDPRLNFIQKPFSNQDLVKKIREILNGEQ